MFIYIHIVQRIWKEYFEDLYNINTQKQVAVPMCSFDGILRGNYFRGDPVGRSEAEVRVVKLKMIKGEVNRVVNWILRVCNMVFERSVVPEDWRSAVIVPLYKGKGEKSEFKNYRGISLFSVVGKIYAGVLIDRVCRVTGGLIDDEQGSFRAGRGV